jgi:hypothetical protein
LNAFLFQEFALSEGEAKKVLLYKIAQSSYSGHLMYQATSYKEQLAVDLENRLSMPLEKFAFMIYLWSIVLQREEPELIIPGIDHKKVTKWRKRRPLWISYPKIELVRWSSWLFEDFFKLRTNLFDGPNVSRFMAHINLATLFGQLKKIRAVGLGTEYYLGDLSLGEVLIEIQETIEQFQNPSAHISKQSQMQREATEALNNSGRMGIRLNHFPLSVWGKIATEQPDFFSTLHVVSRP